MKIGDFFYSLGFKIDTKSLDKSITVAKSKINTLRKDLNKGGLFNTPIKDGDKFSETLKKIGENLDEAFDHDKFERIKKDLSEILDLDKLAESQKQLDKTFGSERIDALTNAMKKLNEEQEKFHKKLTKEETEVERERKKKEKEQQDKENGKPHQGSVKLTNLSRILNMISPGSKVSALLNRFNQVSGGVDTLSGMLSGAGGAGGAGTIASIGSALSSLAVPLGIIVGLFLAIKGTIKFIKKQIADVEKGLNNLKGLLTSLGGAIKNLGSKFGVALDLSSIEKTVEEFERMSYVIDQLNGQLEQTRSSIFGIANDSKTSFNTISSIITKGRNIYGATRMTKGVQSDEQLDAFVTNQMKMIQTFGFNSEETASIVDQLVSELNGGRVDSGTFEKMWQKSAKFQDYLQGITGMAKEDLYKLGKSGGGLLEIDTLISMYDRNADIIEKDYEKIYYSWKDLTTFAKNSVTEIFGNVEEKTKIVQDTVKWFKDILTQVFEYLKSKMDVIVEFINGIIEKAGGLHNILTMIVGVISGLAVLKGLKMLISMFTLANIKAMLVVSSILAIILVIQDLYYFLNGKKSLLGALLPEGEQENVKNSISKLVDSLKELFNSIGELFGASGATFLDKVTSLVGNINKLLVWLDEKIEKWSGTINFLNKVFNPGKVDPGEDFGKRILGDIKDIATGNYIDIFKGIARITAEIINKGAHDSEHSADLIGTSTDYLTGTSNSNNINVNKIEVKVVNNKAKNEEQTAYEIKNKVGSSIEKLRATPTF